MVVLTRVAWLRVSMQFILIDCRHCSLICYYVCSLFFLLIGNIINEEFMYLSVSTS